MADTVYGLMHLSATLSKLIQENGYAPDWTVRQGEKESLMVICSIVKVLEITKGTEANKFVFTLKNLDYYGSAKAFAEGLERLIGVSITIETP